MKLTRAAGVDRHTGRHGDAPPYSDTNGSVPASVEAQDRFLDLLTAAGAKWLTPRIGT
jgi:hypothetical protein